MCSRSSRDRRPPWPAFSSAGARVRSGRRGRRRSGLLQLLDSPRGSPPPSTSCRNRLASSGRRQRSSPARTDGHPPLLARYPDPVVEHEVLAPAAVTRTPKPAGSLSKVTRLPARGRLQAPDYFRGQAGGGRACWVADRSAARPCVRARPRPLPARRACQACWASAATLLSRSWLWSGLTVSVTCPVLPCQPSVNTVYDVACPAYVGCCPGLSRDVLDFTEGYLRCSGKCLIGQGLEKIGGKELLIMGSWVRVPPRSPSYPHAAASFLNWQKCISWLHTTRDAN